MPKHAVRGAGKAKKKKDPATAPISLSSSFKNFNFRNPHPEMRHWISCGIGRDASEMRRTLATQKSCRQRRDAPRRLENSSFFVALLISPAHVAFRARDLMHAVMAGWARRSTDSRPWSLLYRAARETRQTTLAAPAVRAAFSKDIVGAPLAVRWTHAISCHGASEKPGRRSGCPCAQRAPGGHRREEAGHTACRVQAVARLAKQIFAVGCDCSVDG